MSRAEANPSRSTGELSQGRNGRREPVAENIDWQRGVSNEKAGCYRVDRLAAKLHMESLWELKSHLSDLTLYCTTIKL